MFGMKLASHSAAVLCGDGDRGFWMLCRRVGRLVTVRGAGRGVGGEGEGMWGGGGMSGGVSVEGLPFHGWHKPLLFVRRSSS